MNGNSKVVILRKAMSALELADSHAKHGDTRTEKIWRDEYTRLMNRYLGVK